MSDSVSPDSSVAEIPATSNSSSSAMMDVDHQELGQSSGAVLAVPSVSLDDALKKLQQEVTSMSIQIALSGDKPRSEIDPLVKMLSAKKEDLKALKGVVSLVSMDEPISGGKSSLTAGLARFGGAPGNSIVPTGLPLFQWPGFIRDPKLEQFADIEECLRRFEDILTSHGLDFDTNWYRLLPRCLSSDLRDWLNEYVKASGPNVSWASLKAAISGRYGVPKEQLRFDRIRKFLDCSKQESETVDTFLERFKSLKAKSEVTDRFVVAKVFFDAFPKATSRLIVVAMGQAAESSFYDLDYVSAVARRLELAVDKNDGKFFQAASNTGGNNKRLSNDMVVSNEAKKSKYADAPATKSKGFIQQGRSKNVRQFGKTFSEHVTEGSCAKCNHAFRRGEHHVCNTGVRFGIKAGNNNDGNHKVKVIRVLSKKQRNQT
ncbi:hypothetical protein, partial, partial [Parasitella parasitica]